ncbi:MAG: MOSC domain-containing protein [Desulfomonilaceae bacterium]
MSDQLNSDSKKTGSIVAVCVSPKKGMIKTEVDSVSIVEGVGIVDDAHSGDWHRQVSLLAIEEIEKMNQKGYDVRPGSFAENICTRGFNLSEASIGKKIKIGANVILEITQIGKECHTRCAVYNKIGDCIMPQQGVFTKVISGGVVRAGDSVAYI